MLFPLFFVLSFVSQNKNKSLSQKNTSRTHHKATHHKAQSTQKIDRLIITSTTSTFTAKSKVTGGLSTSTLVGSVLGTVGEAMPETTAVRTLFARRTRSARSRRRGGGSASFTHSRRWLLEKKGLCFFGNERKKGKSIKRKKRGTSSPNTAHHTHKEREREQDDDATMRRSDERETAFSSGSSQPCRDPRPGR